MVLYFWATCNTFSPTYWTILDLAMYLESTCLSPSFPHHFYYFQILHYFILLSTVDVSLSICIHFQLCFSEITLKLNKDFNCFIFIFFQILKKLEFVKTFQKVSLQGKLFVLWISQYSNMAGLNKSDWWKSKLQSPKCEEKIDVPWPRSFLSLQNWSWADNNDLPSFYGDPPSDQKSLADCSK